MTRRPWRIETSTSSWRIPGISIWTTTDCAVSHTSPASSAHSEEAGSLCVAVRVNWVRPPPRVTILRHSAVMPSHARVKLRCRSVRIFLAPTVAVPTYSAFGGYRSRRHVFKPLSDWTPLLNYLAVPKKGASGGQPTKEEV